MEKINAGDTINNYLIVGKLKYDKSISFKCKCLNCNKIGIVSYDNLLNKSSNKCSKCRNRKIPASKYKAIYTLFSNGNTIDFLAKLYNVGNSTIRYAIKKYENELSFEELRKFEKEKQVLEKNRVRINNSFIDISNSPKKKKYLEKLHMRKVYEGYIKGEWKNRELFIKDVWNSCSYPEKFELVRTP